MQQTSPVPGVTTLTLHFLLIFISPSFYLFILHLGTFLPLLMLNMQLHPSVNFREYSITLPLWSAQCPNRLVRILKAFSRQQPQGLLFFPALGMLCQPVNAASLVGFVETACAQMWFSCKLIAAPYVKGKREWPVPRQPVSVPQPITSASHDGEPGSAKLSFLGALSFFFFFFGLSRKDKKAWEKSKRCKIRLPFLENY